MIVQGNQPWTIHEIVWGKKLDKIQFTQWDYEQTNSLFIFHQTD